MIAAGKDAAGPPPLPAVLPRIQQLRGVAALLVLALHSAYLFDHTPGEPLAWLFRRVGYAGVDIFFVISGFIVTYAFHRQDGKHHAWFFILRRYCRIYSGYWPVLLFCVLAYRILGIPLGGIDWKGTILLAPISLRYTPITVAWTLYYELYFYLLLGLLLSLPRKWLLPLLGSYAVFILAAQPFYRSRNYFVNAHWIDPADAIHALPSLVFSPFVLEFIAGVFLYALHIGKPAIPPAARRLASLLLVLLALLGLIDNYVIQGGLMVRPTVAYRVILLLPSIVLLFSWAILRDVKGRLLLHGRWLIGIGDASYSLYLLHTPLLRLLDRAVLLAAPAPRTMIAISILTPPAIVLFSLGWYRWIERSLHRRTLGALSRCAGVPARSAL